MGHLKYLNKFFFKYKNKIFTGFVFVVLANVLALLPANLIGKSFNLIVNSLSSINNNSNSDLYQSLLIYSSLLILFALLRGVFMFYMRQNIIVVSRDIEYDLKNEIYQHYQKLSFDFYQNNDSGDLLNRITEDVSRVRMYLGPAVMYSFNLITLIILIISRMLFVSPFLTFVVLLPLPLLSYLIYRVSNKINLRSSKVQQTLSSLTNSVQESFSGIRLIKSFVKEKNIIKHFNQLSNQYMNEHISLARVNSVFFPLVLLLVGVSILLTVYVGGNLVLEGLITIGEVTEFIIYVNMLTWPVTSVGWVTEVIQRASASQERINEFLNKNDFTIYSRKNEGQLKNIIFKECIKLKDICYVYPKSNFVAINKISLSIKRSNIVAFAGNIGSGKSTILKLLTGVIVPSSGNLFFDKTCFQDINWSIFRKKIAYVSQDVFLFSDTIRNNILFGNKNILDKDLIFIIDQLCLLAEIQSFSDGLDTYVGEGGITLSGGQKQRVAIARALITKPDILILDDALSSIDSETEFKILNFISKYLSSTTIVLSSNRLSVLSICDKIYVLKSGFLIQEGTSKELMQQDGLFKKLFINQIRLT
ncbi:MAG: ABC transporter ATP-binding protein [Flavobacteriales bacterium TMED191]|nr:MAG: ABC transporter ATP-binding protein [Flavobacteriales bacterium TMED191]